MSQFPLTYLGQGRFETTPYHAARLDYGQGEVITVEEVQERSAKSHKHYFACINDAWKNLREDIAEDYPNPETLRKRALIKTGLCTMTDILCASHSHAIKLAAEFSKADPYCLCEISDRAVRIWRAESQSVKAMGGKKFAESKEKVLHWISNLIGADVTELRKEAA
jgi:hypothetical protein